MWLLTHPFNESKFLYNNSQHKKHYLFTPLFTRSDVTMAPGTDIFLEPWASEDDKLSSGTLFLEQNWLRSATVSDNRISCLQRACQTTGIDLCDYPDILYQLQTIFSNSYPSSAATNLPLCENVVSNNSFSNCPMPSTCIYSLHLQPREIQECHCVNLHIYLENGENTLLSTTGEKNKRAETSWKAWSTYWKLLILAEEQAQGRKNGSCAQRLFIP